MALVVDSGGRERERLVGRQSMEMRDLDLLIALQSMETTLENRMRKYIKLKKEEEKQTLARRDHPG